MIAFFMYQDHLNARPKKSENANAKESQKREGDAPGIPVKNGSQEIRGEQFD